VNRAEDRDRLIHDVLSELGWDTDPKKIAENVPQLDLGLLYQAPDLLVRFENAQTLSFKLGYFPRLYVSSP